jgi:hypothetical protein
MECGCRHGKRCGAINGTPVASTGGTPARRWLENLTELERDKTKVVRVAFEKSFLVIGRVLPGEASPGKLSEITTDPETMPENSTWYVMTEIPGLKYKDVGNLYGCRNWAEYDLN